MSKPTSRRRRRRSAPKDKVADLIDALHHPWRRSILSYLQQEGRGSPSEIARSLGVPLTGLAYHVRRLEETGLIQETETVRRRGALMRVFEPSAELRAAAAAFLEDELVVLASLAPSDGRAVIVADLDQQAFAELDAEIVAFRSRIEAMHRETAAGAEGSQGSLPVRVTVVLAFERATSYQARPETRDIAAG